MQLLFWRHAVARQAGDFRLVEYGPGIWKCMTVLTYPSPFDTIRISIISIPNADDLVKSGRDLTDPQDVG